MERIPKKSIKVNALFSVIKQLLSIIFPMITLYYATRVLGKENYGMVNFTKSIVSYFSLLAGLGVSTYAIREGARIRDSKDRFFSFANEVFTINVYSTIISFVGVCVLSFISEFKDWNINPILYYVFAISFLLITIGADWINSIYEDYAYITVRYIIIYAISLILMFILVKQQSDYVKYSLLLVVASAGGNILNVYYIRRYAHLKLVSISKCKQHIKPILILFVSAIASVIYINSDITLIGIFDGNETVALYNVASQIYIAIKHIVNAAVIVTIPRLSFYQGNDNQNMYNGLIGKIMDYALFLILPLIVGLFELSNPVMVFMGGAEYGDGSLSLRILSLSLVFAVISYILSSCILIPQKKDITFLIATIVSAIINITLNIILIPIISLNGAALTTLISEIVLFIILWRKCKICGIIKFNKKVIISSVIACLPIIVVCEIIKKMNFNVVFSLASSVFLCTIAYLAISFTMHNPVAKDILSLIKTIIIKAKNKNQC